MTHRKFAAEAVGTAVLVIIGVGVATLSFGFKLAGVSTSAGVVATALAFGWCSSPWPTRLARSPGPTSPRR